MFDAIIKKEHFAPFVDASDAVVHEVNVHVEANGLRVTAVDPANVAMVSEMLGERAFEHYDADERLSLGLAVSSASGVGLADAIGPADSDDLLHFEYGGEPGDRLIIDAGPAHFEVATIDPDSIRQEPDLPELGDELIAEISVECRVVEQAIAVVELVSDHVRVDVDPDAPVVDLVAEGDADDVNVALGPDELLEGSSIDQEGSVLLSTDYLKDLLKPIPSDATITMRFGDEYPTVWSWSFGDGHGSVTNALAPRIDTM